MRGPLTKRTPLTVVTATGVALTSELSEPFPLAFAARTWNLYAAPFVSDPTV